MRMMGEKSTAKGILEWGYIQTLIRSTHYEGHSDIGAGKKSIFQNNWFNLISQSSSGSTPSSMGKFWAKAKKDVPSSKDIAPGTGGVKLQLYRRRREKPVA